jgi:tRNA-dihydrouridine synthase
MFEETGCDAVMVGRAALTHPWIFSEYRKGRDIYVPLSERLKTVLKLLEWMFGYYPSRERACFEVRSLLVRLIKGFERSAEIKAEVMTLRDCEAFRRKLEEFAERFETLGV